MAAEVPHAETVHPCIICHLQPCPRSLSKLIEESTRSSSVGGMLNPRWLAPEVLTGGSASAASDVFRWAWGGGGCWGCCVHRQASSGMCWEQRRLAQHALSLNHCLPRPCSAPCCSFGVVL